MVRSENENAMKEPKKVRSRWLNIRLNEEEETQIKKLFSRSTCNSLGEYARDLLLKNPIHFFYRNQSADEFLAEMILLKQELNAIGNNFNQLVHKLHTLDHISDIKPWAIHNESVKNLFMKKVDEILEKANQIYELWLQK